MPRLAFSSLLQIALAGILLVCLSLFVVRTWHWPLAGDASLLHYMVFLIHHGRVPYRDFVDVNMPGAYFVEGAAMRAMGGGALAWRLFDLLLGAAAILAMIVIAGPRNRFAGFLAGGLFLLVHGRDGCIDLGQRDLTLTVLVLASYAFFFSALRTERPRWRFWSILSFGLCLGAAITVKPTAIFLPLPLLVLVAIELRRRRQSWRLPIAAAAAAMLVPALLALLYLLREHALAAFLTVVFRLIPAHARLDRVPPGRLLAHALAGNLLAPVLLWLPVALFARLRRNWETSALLLGMAFGLFSFYVQHKGFSYHRYPLEAFLLLFLCIDLTAALAGDRAEQPRWSRPCAAVVLTLLVVVAGIGSTRKALAFNARSDAFGTMLRADLTRLGGPSLNGRVQCIDMASGCLATLYRMRLVQSTGFLFDCYVLRPAPGDGGYRERFWQELQAHPPAVIVVTSSQCDNQPRNYSWSKLGQWPQFAAWLATNYSLYAQRIPTQPLFWTGRPGLPFGYRVYLRDDIRPSPGGAAPVAVALRARERSAGNS